MAEMEIQKKLAGLSEAKRRLLEQRLREAGIVLEGAAIPARRPDEIDWPLSFGQQRFWFLEQLDPGSALNNIPVAVRMKGELNLPVFEQCLAEIILRHEVLRTSFIKQEGQPVQVIAPATAFPLRIVDLMAVPPAQREETARGIVAAESRTPIDLSQAPLCRATLIRMTESEYLLIAVMHHIISDGWSMGVFIRELAALYHEFLAGRASPLPPLEIQYADYARWQRQRLQGELLERELSYWRRKLGDGGDPLDLPTDRPRPVLQTNRGASILFSLDRELTEKLKALSQQEEATLFMTLLAGFQTLLYRYTGQEKISVGTPIANRQRKELEPLIGFFVNTLVMRTDLSGEPSFREAIRRVREVALGAYAHQDLPFEKLVEALGVERDLSRTPLFQAMFILQNTPGKNLELPGLTLQPEEAETEQATFDLTLSMAESDGALSGAIEYNTDLFDRETIDDLIAHFRILLDGAVSTPDLSISRLPLLAEAECRRMLTEWNRTDLDVPLDRCIHHMFEEQAEKNPEAVAVTDGHRSLSYGELEGKANRLARYLQRLGVGPESLVGICLERSPSMLIAILGIWKAGGAYVPLDPLYPTERLHLMLDDAGARVLIVQESLRPRLGEPSIPVVFLDSDWEKIEQESPERPTSDVGLDNLVYVLYTSGSTGKPKGVMVRHRGLVNAFHGWRQAYDLSPLRSYLGIANITFDVFLGDIIRPLASGTKFVLCPREILFSPDKLYDLMIREEVDYLEIVPAVLRPLLVYLGQSGRRLDFLRVIVCGADSWMVGEYRQLKRFSGEKTRVFNSYGVTEATVDNTFYEGGLEGYADDQVLPLGIAYANQKLYVLDAHLQPQPIGVAGELYIGGEGVARGYLNNPSLTAEKFIEWLGLAGYAPAQRLYKTGDRARWRRDGAVQFFGRADFQVKIRGFRIEPGEVEAVLQQHPAVRQTAVVAHRDPDGDTQLVAYFTSKEDIEPTTIAALRDFLKGKLPEYMIPGYFIPLEEMPLTSSGKIARRALPAPDRGQATREENFVAPRTERERQLAEIWAAVLKLEQIGITANFFEMGGHSLLATLLISRVRDTLGVDLPLRSLFEAPTVAEFSALVETALQAGDRQSMPSIRPVSREGDLPLSFGQQRLWFFDQFEPGSSAYNVPAAVRIAGQLDYAVLTRCLNEIVRRHEVLRISFASDEGRPRLVIAPELSLSIPIEDLRELPPPERENEAMRQAYREAFLPFDLSQGPLLRVRLWRLAEDEHLATVTMHHIVSDGWSSGILIRDLATLYRAYLAGHPSPLPELEVQYADYAKWQRDWLQGEVLEQELEYWRNQLGDGGEPLALPTDRPRTADQTVRGASELFELSEKLSRQLRDLSQRVGTTLFMTLLAGFQALLHRYSGQQQISIGTPNANRHSSEIEPLIGFFVNTLVMRADFRGDPSFRQLLGRVREVALGAFAHQEMPFDKLVDALGVERNMSYSPLFQVMFILQNVPRQELSIEGLTFTGVEFESKVATFDLTLAMEEVEDGRLTGAVEYNPDLFDRETIARMMSHYCLLLESAVAGPDQPVSLLNLLPETERRQVLYDWNDTAADVLLDQCIHRLFERHADAAPEAVAIVYQGAHLTYGELESRANRLARYLQKLGVGPERLVGLCLERSLELFVAILGIWKAGGAYVPIDPLYPEERINLLLDDAQPLAVITQDSLLPKLGDWKMPLVCLDRDWKAIAEESRERPSSDVGPENMVYVIYTSGSTGRPKGVVVRHRGLVNAYYGWNLAYDLSPLKSYLGIANVTFDVFVGDLVRPLCNGAKYVVSPREILFSPPDFYRLLKEEEVDYLEFVPAVMRPLTEYLEESGNRLDFIRVIICGADTWSVGEFQRFKKLCGAETRLFNSYGVTEATIDNTYYEGELEGYRPDQVLPLGIAYANQQLYVLDSRLQPQPIGVPGELCIGGDGLARGYLNNPGMTAEKFILWHRDGQGTPPVRIYRTGDLARWHRDGHVQFLGRNDFQVKIRGFRIETGEIEAVLGKHPNIGQALVIAREDEGGRKRLVAYLVPQRGAQLEIGSIKAYLGEQLPEYMIPSAFVRLEALPVTSHGKIDRKKLPAPQFEAHEESAPPSTALEEKLIAIWKEVLGIEQVGVTDNFFELGGDSILSIQIIARARQAGIQLTPRQLFENPTVRGQAGLAQVGQAIEAEQGVVTGPVPLTPIQQWFFEQDFAAPWHWNQTVLIEVHQPVDRPLLESALARLVAHHDALRMRYQRDAAGWRQDNAPLPEVIPMAWHDLSALNDADAVTAIESHCAELQAGISLERGCLLQAAYFDLGSDRPGRLMLAIHHLAVDGVSWRILLEDLPTILLQLSRREEVSLPLKTTSFRHWAGKLAEYAQSGEARGEFDYWMSVVEGALVQLPVNDVRGTNFEADVVNVVVSLEADETQALLKQIPAAYGTEINDALLAALAEALSQWTGSRAILVTLEGHGREDILPGIDLSRTVGWFTTAFPIRLEAVPDARSIETLQHVKEQLRRIPRKGFGYGLLRYLCEDDSIRGELSRQPEAEIGFNYLGQMSQSQAREEDQAFRLAKENVGPMSSPRAGRSNLIDINGGIAEDRLQIVWSFSEKQILRPTIESVAGEFIAALRRIIAECQAPDAGGYTPSDFDLAGLDRRKLDKVLGKLSRGKKK